MSPSVRGTTKHQSLRYYSLRDRKGVETGMLANTPYSSLKPRIDQMIALNVVRVKAGVQLI